MIKVEIPYKPHLLQILLHEDKHRFKTIVCGRRFGKTIFAINELIKCAMQDVGDYWYVAPTYKQAKRIVWRKLKKYAVDAIVYKKNESELFIEFINGSTIRLLGAEDEDSLRGDGLKGVVLDEYADMSRTLWDLVIRPALTDYEGWAIFLGTPKGKLNALYEKFISDSKFEDKEYLDLEGNPVKSDEDYASFRFRTIDNPHASRKEIEKARRKLAPQYFRQEYEASFENYTGLIYKEFDTQKHVIPAFEIPNFWNIYVGIDTGRTSCITFLAKDDKNNEYVFDEIYDFDSTVKVIAEKIRYKLNIHRIDENRVDYIIDSASQVKREYRENKIFCRDSEKDVTNQISQVRNRFSSNKLFFFDNCKMHIIEHQGYIWDSKARTPQPEKKNDHSCNSLQYIFSTYSIETAIDKVKEEEEKRSLLYLAQNNYKLKMRGQYS